MNRLSKLFLIILLSIFISTVTVVVSDRISNGINIIRGLSAQPTSITIGDIITSSPYIDVRYYGASPTSSPSANTSAIMTAINLARLSKKPIYVPSGNYSLIGPLTIGNSAQYNGFKMFGDGPRSTIFTMSGSLNDIIQIGATDHDYAYEIDLSDFGTSGGRYGINLNGVAGIKLRNLEIKNSVVGLYGQGSIESLDAWWLRISGSSQNGILLGQLNGGTAGLGLNYPMIQKSIFDHIRVAGTTGGTAIVVSAGSLGGQQTSLGNIFRHTLLESNSKGGMFFDHCDRTTVDTFSTEDNLDTGNAYDGISMTTGNLTFRNLQIVASPNRYRYGFYNQNGIAKIYDSVIQYSDTYDINFAPTSVGGLIVDTAVISLAKINLQYNHAGFEPTVINLRDSNSYAILNQVGDLNINKVGKGVVMTNVAGTISKRVRLNDTGDGLIYEAP